MRYTKNLNTILDDRTEVAAEFRYGVGSVITSQFATRLIVLLLFYQSDTSAYVQFFTRYFCKNFKKIFQSDATVPCPP